MSVPVRIPEREYLAAPVEWVNITVRVEVVAFRTRIVDYGVLAGPIFLAPWWNKPDVTGKYKTEFTTREQIMPWAFLEYLDENNIWKPLGGQKATIVVEGPALDRPLEQEVTTGARLGEFNYNFGKLPRGSYTVTFIYVGTPAEEEVFVEQVPTAMEYIPPEQTAGVTLPSGNIYYPSADKTFVLGKGLVDGYVP